VNFFANFFIKDAFFFVKADSAQPWQLGFQDPATPTIEGIIRFHNDMIFLLVLIVVFVGWIMFRC
jgi:cytochrome c oxidase subunit 2